jgi:hypothetical protein
MGSVLLQQYRSKLDELTSALTRMGKDPKEVSNWLLNHISEHNITLVNIQQIGSQSLALIKALPQSTSQSILGLQLTDDVRLKQAMDSLSSDQAHIIEEINKIEAIGAMIHKLHGQVGMRVNALKEARAHFQNIYQAGGEESEVAHYQSERLLVEAMPILMRLQSELHDALQYCREQIRIRHEHHHELNMKQLRIPKYNRNARKKRLRRAALRDKIKETNKEETTNGGDSRS